MFDSLKDKLGRFRDDVEEAAEETVEPLDEDEATGEDADELDEATGEERLVEEHRDAGTQETAGSEPTQAADADLADADFDRDTAGVADEGEAVSNEGDAAMEEGETAGDDASADTGFGHKARSLVRGRFVIEEEDLEGPLWDLEMALLQSDVEMSVAEAILGTIREELIGETRTFTQRTGNVVEGALREAILEVISVGQFDFDRRIDEAEKPVVIVFTGVNGVGKTTSIAKLSAYLAERGFSSVLANGDTYRAGANEQIEEHARRLDRKLISHEQGGDPAAVLYDAVEYARANDVDVVLGDTAGRLHTDQGLMDQLAKIDRVVDPDLALFVDEAVAGQDAVNRAREFDEAAPFDGAILTKADADANGGAAISIAHVTGKPILFLGTGQAYDDLVRFEPEEMVERLLGE